VQQKSRSLQYFTEADAFAAATADVAEEVDEYGRSLRCSTKADAAADDTEDDQRQDLESP